MIEYPLSPISLGGFSILSFAIDFSDAIREEKLDSDRNVTIEFNVNTNHERLDDGSCRCACALTLACNVYAIEGENAQSTHLGAINAKFLGTAAGAFQADEPDDAVRETLEANAVSFLYGKARTYIELVTAFCPEGPISLPAIMPTPKEAQADPNLAP